MRDAAEVEKISRHSLVEWDDIVHASSSEKTLLDSMLEMEALYTNGMSYNKAVALYELSKFSRASVIDEAKHAKLMKVAIRTNATPDQINRALQGDSFLSKPKYPNDQSVPLASTILVTATKSIDEKIKGSTQELLAYKKNDPSRIGDAESFWDAIKTKHQDPVILQRLEAALVKLGVFYQIEQASFQKYIFESEQHDILLYKHQPAPYTSILLKLWGQANTATARFKIAHLEIEPKPQNQKSIHTPHLIPVQIANLLSSWTTILIYFDTTLPAQQANAASEVPATHNILDTHIRYLGSQDIVDTRHDKSVVVPLSVRTSLEAFDAYNTSNSLGYMMHQLDSAKHVDYVVVSTMHLWLEAQFTLIELALTDTADEALNAVLSYIEEASLEQMFNDFNASAQPTLSAADDQAQSHIRAFIHETIQTNQQHTEYWEARFREDVTATAAQQMRHEQVAVSKSSLTHASVEHAYYTQWLLAQERNTQLPEVSKLASSTVDTITRFLIEHYQKFTRYKNWRTIESHSDSVLYGLKNLHTEALLILLYFFNNDTFLNHFNDVEKQFILDREVEMKEELQNRALHNSEDQQAFSALLEDFDIKNNIIILKGPLEHTEFNEGNKLTNLIGFITPHVFTILKDALQRVAQPLPTASDVHAFTPGAPGLFSSLDQEEQEPEQLSEIGLRTNISP